MSARGLCPRRLERLTDTLRRHVERTDPPGLVALVSRGDDVFCEAFGTLAVGGGAPVQRDTIFRIASMSKPVVAAAALTLVEECRLRLDDPVDDLLPELANRQVLRRIDGPLDETEPARRAITLRDLLTFRLGFGLVFGAPGQLPIVEAIEQLKFSTAPPNPSLPPAPDEWLRRLGTLPLMYQPGERWLYHWGADVLGVLVARAAGQPLDTVLHERIFAPLGMRDTSFSVPAGQIDRLATAYARNPATGELVVADQPVGGQWSSPPAFPSAGGGLVSTIDDYHAFARMLLNHGVYPGGRLLSRGAVELMTSDQLTPAQKEYPAHGLSLDENEGWGFCVSVVTARRQLGESAGAYGWNGGLGSTWRNDPREGLISLLLTQCYWDSPVLPAVFRDFSTLAYRALDG